MATRTTHSPGTFSWVDLQTSDPEAANSFYSALFGWDYDERPTGEGRTYAMARIDGEFVSAIAPMPPGAQFPPHWNSYVTVESADDTAAKARELGGATPMEPFDVFDAGRMGVIADPTGAVLLVWEPREHIGAGRVNDPGCFTWNELGTKDPETAAAFYGDLFGWTYDEQDMGPMGVYRTIKNGERMNGGIRKQSEQEAEVPPNWLVYFTTEDIDAAVGQVGELGGQVMMPPTDLPMGARIAVLTDPQGAAFALFQGEVED
jgi:predicted enzyme related to lactoylglutathione lyase